MMLGDNLPASPDGSRRKLGLWHASPAHCERYAVHAAFLFAALLCLLSLYQTSLLFIDTLYDIYIPLNAALRLLQGAWPSRDYPSPIGLLYAVMHGLMLWIDSVDARSVIRADVVILLLSYLLLWPNMQGLPRALKAIAIVLLAGMMMTPLALDSSWGSYRYVADYNRWSWAFYAVVLAWICNPAARGPFAQIAVALALCCLLYLKLTVFAGAALTLGAGFFNGRRQAEYVVPVLAVILAIGIGTMAGVFLPYLRDNIAASHATNSLRLGKFLVQFLAPYNFPAILMAIAVCFVRELPGRIRMLPLCCMFIQQAVALQNFDVMVPLTGLPLLFLAPQLAWVKPRFLKPALMPFPALLQAAYIFSVAALAFAAQAHVAAASKAQSVSGPQTLGERLKISTLPSTGFGTGGGDLPYADDVIVHDMQSALELLAQLPQGTHVATLEVTNIAAAAWPRLRPSTGGLLWYDYHRSYSEEAYPAPGEAFAGADVILVPVHFTTASARQLVALYRPWLDRCANMIAANDLWQLYRPKGNSENLTQPGTAKSVSDGKSPAQLSTLDADCFILARP